MWADRVLVTGWYSFLHGEATAGDVLAGDAVTATLDAAGIPYDVAWSPGFRADGLHLEDADPDEYHTVVFACGPLHSNAPGSGIPSPLLDLHARFTRCRRIAVGVSVLDATDPAVTGFDVVLPRDGAGSDPQPDLALAAPEPDAVPVVGVILTDGQHEYGVRRRHGSVASALTGWLHGLDVARVPLDTRLDAHDWRLFATPGQLRSVLSRLDVVVTTRLHGLVLGLQAGVPVLAVDPVDGGAKVTAQARALDWPAVLDADRLDELPEWWDWCRSPAAHHRAAAYRSGRPDGLTRGLIEALGVLPQV
ncbi:polysaccharide pyruvyl transferase family protein [Cryptosporangium phraense]|uniref:Polysaccharide pyruvyl transferase family protein n=1 Tax=Cryptosporangium phraense TaxID=2593070 RepID=A0A545AX84_9ACTN|nr:polysaccharide pyruvyl transferase family protein [Cryptosporangium phraense]TQS45934.1 polysaccharide pyruvyl transferase family protein [Cryptosporangium phraense]